MPANFLTVTTRPFKSSHLTIPPSPFSPKLPVTPAPAPPSHQRKVRRDLVVPSPPTAPLHWLWQCHMCSRVYQLGVTRRCLDDGHYFCAGTTTVRRSKRNGYKKTVRHKACASEFDYKSWRDYGDWRRNVQEQIDAAETLEQFLKFEEDGEMVLDRPTPKKANTNHRGKNCWNKCDYPSECRWGKQYGIQTPTLASATETTPQVTVTADSASLDTATTSFEDIMLDVSDITDEILSEGDAEDHEAQIPATTPTSPVEEKKPSMDDLLESAKRRKRRSAGVVPSPLASNPPSPSTSETSTGSASSSSLHRAFDDFELDLRKSFGRAGGAVSSLFGGSGRSRKRSNGTW